MEVSVRGVMEVPVVLAFFNKREYNEAEPTHLHVLCSVPASSSLF